MWFNDIFLSKLHDAMLSIPINQRREVIHRIVIRLKLMLPSRLYQLWLDGETLVGILQAAMKWEEYRIEYNTSTMQNFFDDIMIDEYDKFVRDTMK
jgi:hypothetical protein